MIWLLAFLFVFLYISGLFVFRALVKACDCTDKDQPLVLIFWFVWFSGLCGFGWRFTRLCGMKADLSGDSCYGAFM